MKFTALAVLVIGTLGFGTQAVDPPESNRSRISPPVQGERAVTADNVIIDGLYPLDVNASMPDFSPVDDLIAYDKDDSHGSRRSPCVMQCSAIWISDIGGVKKQRIAEGSRPSWSPDGNRLAYYRSGKLYLYDRSKSREYELVSAEVYQRDLEWTKDGKQIVLSQCSGKFGEILRHTDDAARHCSASLLDLDTLTWSKLSDNIQGYKDWRRQNIPTVRTHPDLNLYIYDGSDPFLGSIKGIWVRNLDGSFHRFLQGGAIKQVRLSRDSTWITFGGRRQLVEADDQIEERNGVYVGRLAAGPDVQREFEIQAANSELGNPAEGCRGRISEPRINPLNDKVVGPGGRTKAYGIVAKRYSEKAIIRVTTQRRDVKPGDVLHGLTCSGETIAERERLEQVKNAGWFVLSHISDATTQGLSDATLSPTNTPGAAEGRAPETTEEMSEYPRHGTAVPDESCFRNFKESGSVSDGIVLETFEEIFGSDRSAAMGRLEERLRAAGVSIVSVDPVAGSLTMENRAPNARPFPIDFTISTTTSGVRVHVKLKMRRGQEITAGTKSAMCGLIGLARMETN